MEPTFASRVVALALDVLVRYVRIVSTKPNDFLLETMPCLFHKDGIAAVPEFAASLNRSRYPIAVRFDHVLVQ